MRLPDLVFQSLGYCLNRRGWISSVQSRSAISSCVRTEYAKEAAPPISEMTTIANARTYRTCQPPAMAPRGEAVCLNLTNKKLAVW
jgi:hypothetical protein